MIANLKITKNLSSQNDKNGVFGLNLLRLQNQNSLGKSRGTVNSNERKWERQVSSSESQSSITSKNSSNSILGQNQENQQSPCKSSNHTSLNTQEMDEDSGDSDESKTLSLSSIFQPDQQMNLQQINEISESSRKDNYYLENKEASTNFKTTPRGQRGNELNAKKKVDNSASTSEHISKRFENMERILKKAEQKQIKLQENTKQLIESQIDNKIDKMHNNAQYFLINKLKHKPSVNIRSISVNRQKALQETINQGLPRQFHFDHNTRAKKSCLLAKNLLIGQKQSKFSELNKHNDVDFRGSQDKAHQSHDKMSSIVNIEKRFYVANQQQQQNLSPTDDNEKFFDSQNQSHGSNRMQSQQFAIHQRIKSHDNQVSYNYLTQEKTDGGIQKFLTLKDYVQKYQNQVQKQSNTNAKSHDFKRIKVSNKGQKKISFDNTSIYTNLDQHIRTFQNKNSSLQSSVERLFSNDGKIKNQFDFHNKFEILSDTNLHLKSNDCPVQPMDQSCYSLHGAKSNQKTIQFKEKLHDSAIKLRNTLNVAEPNKVQIVSIQDQDDNPSQQRQLLINKSQFRQRLKQIQNEQVVKQHGSNNQKYQPYVDILQQKHAPMKRPPDRINIVGPTNGNQRQVLRQDDQAKFQNDLINTFVEQYESRVKSQESDAKLKRRSIIKVPQIDEKIQTHSQLNIPYTHNMLIKRRKVWKTRSNNDETIKLYSQKLKGTIDDRKKLEQVNETIKSQNTMALARNSIDSGSYNFTQFQQQPQQDDEIFSCNKHYATNNTMINGNCDKSPKTMSTNFRGSVQSIQSSAQFNAPIVDNPAVQVNFVKTALLQQQVKGIQKKTQKLINLLDRCDTTLTDAPLSNAGGNQMITQNLTDQNKRIKRFLDRQSQKVSAINIKFEEQKHKNMTQVAQSEISMNNSFLKDKLQGIANERAKQNGHNRFRQVLEESNHSNVPPRFMLKDYSGLNMFMNENHSLSTSFNND